MYAECWICKGSEGITDVKYCHCIGDLSYVHSECLVHWIRVSGTKQCKFCQYTYILKEKERRRPTVPHYWTEAQTATFYRWGCGFLFIIFSWVVSFMLTVLSACYSWNIALSVLVVSVVCIYPILFGVYFVVMVLCIANLLTEFDSYNSYEMSPCVSDECLSIKID
nr:hypothetical protein pBo4 [Bovine gammaherpesvirus 4]